MCAARNGIIKIKNEQDAPLIYRVGVLVDDVREIPRGFEVVGEGPQEVGVGL